MAYIYAVLSAVVTGAIVAGGLRLYGVHHFGLLLASAIIAGGVQLAALIAWYLAWSSNPRD